MVIEVGRVFTHAEDSLCAHCHTKIYRALYRDDNSLSPWLHLNGSGGVWCHKLKATPVSVPRPHLEDWDNEGGYVDGEA